MTFVAGIALFGAVWSPLAVKLDMKFPRLKGLLLTYTR